MFYFLLLEFIMANIHQIVTLKLRLASILQVNGNSFPLVKELRADCFLANLHFFPLSSKESPGRPVLS